MSEYFEHNPQDHEDPLPGPTWIVGLIGAVLLVVTVLALTALFYGADRDESQAKLAPPPIDLEELRVTQNARLEGPARWEETLVDGQVTDRRLVIPIDDAMLRIAREARQP